MKIKDQIDKMIIHTKKYNAKVDALYMNLSTYFILLKELNSISKKVFTIIHTYKGLKVRTDYLIPHGTTYLFKESEVEKSKREFYPRLLLDKKKPLD